MNLLRPTVFRTASVTANGRACDSARLCGNNVQLRKTILAYQIIS